MKKIEKVNKVKDLFRVHCASVFFSRLLWPRVIIDLHFSINYFFLGKTLSNNHQCVIPYKDFLISIKQHRLFLKEPNFLPVSSDALINTMYKKKYKMMTVYSIDLYI